MRGSSRFDPAGTAAWAVALILSLAAFPTLAASPALDFTVRHVDTRVVGETWLLDAGIELDFNPESREAMESGVPLTVLLEVEVTREGLLRDERIRRLQLRYRLERHALSRRYMLTFATSGKTRTYVDFTDASRSLGTIRALKLMGRGQALPGHVHRVRLRARLDIEDLPSPLRPLAWLRSLLPVRGNWFTWVLSS